MKNANLKRLTLLGAACLLLPACEDLPPTEKEVQVYEKGAESSQGLGGEGADKGSKGSDTSGGIGGAGPAEAQPPDGGAVPPGPAPVGTDAPETEPTPDPP